MSCNFQIRTEQPKEIKGKCNAIFCIYSRPLYPISLLNDKYRNGPGEYQLPEIACFYPRGPQRSEISYSLSEISNEIPKSLEILDEILKSHTEI